MVCGNDTSLAEFASTPDHIYATTTRPHTPRVRSPVPRHDGSTRHRPGECRDHPAPETPGPAPRAAQTPCRPQSGKTPPRTQIRAQQSSVNTLTHKVCQIVLIFKIQRYAERKKRTRAERSGSSAAQSADGRRADPCALGAKCEKATTVYKAALKNVDG
jgi:hypothetical protein